jgi:hypothetical protein
VEKERLNALFQLAIAVGRRKGLLANEPPSASNCIQHPDHSNTVASENTKDQEFSREVSASQSIT